MRPLGPNSAVLVSCVTKTTLEDLSPDSSMMHPAIKHRTSVDVVHFFPTFLSNLCIVTCVFISEGTQCVRVKGEASSD